MLSERMSLSRMHATPEIARHTPPTHAHPLYAYREGPGAAQKLLAQGLDVVEVNVRISQHVHQIAGAQATHLGHHKRQQRIRGDVERDAKAQIGAALVHLARQLALGHEKLGNGGEKGRGFRVCVVIEVGHWE